MAGILEKLNSDIRTRNARMDLHLEFIRFRKFLQNMREIINLIEDAKDKLCEEYIFDRHYALSLVDGVLEKASMLAFNSSVLAPVAGKEVYSQLDVLKVFAQEEFLKSPCIRTERFAISSLSPDSDPEMELLSAVLNWFRGPLPGNQPAVMDFVLFAANGVLGNCRKEALIEKMSASVGNVKLSEYSFLKPVDIDGVSSPKSKRSVSCRDIQCRPFGLLLVGVLDGTANGGIHKAESGMNRWMLYDEENISLRLSGENEKVHLEASLSGNVATDFIFLYSQNPFDSKCAFPEGSWVENTGQGTIAWIFDVPTDHLERELVQLGPMLLSPDYS